MGRHLQILIIFPLVAFLPLHKLATTADSVKADAKLQTINAELGSQAAYRVLKSQYKWLNSRIYRYSVKYGNLYSVSPLLVLAVIDAESTGVRKAKGKRVKVRLASGKYVRTNALGLMQLIPVFHAPKKAWRLYRTEFNIKLGTRYLKRCLQWADGNLSTALKNYNSGPRSPFYNWPYIKKIRRNYAVSVSNLSAARSDLVAGL